VTFFGINRQPRKRLWISETESAEVPDSVGEPSRLRGLKTGAALHSASGEAVVKADELTNSVGGLEAWLPKDGEP